MCRLRSVSGFLEKHLGTLLIRKRRTALVSADGHSPKQGARLARSAGFGLRCQARGFSSPDAGSRRLRLADSVTPKDL
jgi:hypothetical protein